MKTLLTAFSVLSLIAATAGATPRVRLISHRGESLVAPENTMAAFRLAHENGADGFECDIYLTKDNEIICLHDTTAKRTAGLDAKPRDVTSAELRVLDAGAWKAPQYTGERIPTLTETLTLARDNFEIYVEIKSGLEIMPRLIEVMAAAPYATPERVVFIAFNADIIAAVRQQFPAYRAYWLTGTGPNRQGKPGITVEKAIETAKACNASGISAQNSADITPEFVGAVKATGMSFHIWTVNNAQRARELAAMGVETVTSDCGAAIAAILAGRLDTRPAIHWTFDKETQNRGTSGVRYHATLAGTPEYTEGVLSQGLRLDGKDDTASAPYALCAHGAVALWFKPESFYNYNTVFDNDINPNHWEMWCGDDGRVKFRIAPKSGEVEYDLNALGGAGKWHHLAVVWDCVEANKVWLYVDGIERASAPARWHTSGGTFTIGGGNAGNTKGTGIVDDVRVYGAPLSPQQVKALSSR